MTRAAAVAVAQHHAAAFGRVYAVVAALGEYWPILGPNFGPGLIPSLPLPPDASVTDWIDPPPPGAESEQAP